MHLHRFEPRGILIFLFYKREETSFLFPTRNTALSQKKKNTRNTAIALMVNGISYIFPCEIDFNFSNLKRYCLQWEERIIRDYN